MAFTISEIPKIQPTGPIRLVATKSGEITLYMAQIVSARRAKPPYYDFETVLSPLGSGDNALPATITIPQPLPISPDWDLCVTSDGAVNMAYQVFGGGWNVLQVGAVADGEVPYPYGYGVRNCGAPRFLRDSSGNGPAMAWVSFVFEYQKLGLLIPQQSPPVQGGKVAAGFLSLAEASHGVAFGDLSGGDLPGSLTLAYKIDRRTGPLSPGGLFLGKLALADYDLTKKTLAAPQPLLSGAEVGEFDAAIQEGVYCLLASTGDGAPLLAAFDGGGKSLGTPYLPFGSWNGPGRWVANPTLVADPANSTSQMLSFTIAFILYEADAPKAIYTGNVQVSPSSGVIPFSPPAAPGA